MKLLIILIILLLLILCKRTRYDKQLNYNFPINELDNTLTYDKNYSIIYDDLFYNKERYDFETHIILDLIDTKSTKSSKSTKLINWLDLACGTSKHYSNHISNIKYTGLDKSEHMLTQGINNNNKSKSFINRDLADLADLDETYDIITSFYCGLFYVKNIEKLLDDIYNKLTGYFIIVCLKKHKLENLTLKLKYNDKVIGYEGIWENIEDKTYYREYFYDNTILIYYNEHIMYIPENIDKIIESKFNIIKRIEYKTKFDAGDEYMLILKKKKTIIHYDYTNNGLKSR